MYGSWSGAIVAVLVVFGLLIAAALTAWTPLFAFVIFGVIGSVLLVLAAMRRSAEDRPGTAVHSGDPERYAAPADGEGAPRSGEPGHPEPDQAPQPQSAGVWGER
jgi:hypothetical protein